MNKYDDTDYQIEREESIEYEKKTENIEDDLTTVYLKGYADAEEKYKARIKELESKLEEANNKLDLDYVDKNYIPVEKVEYKIEEAKYNKKVGNTAYEYTEEDVWDIVKDELEKLLEGKN